ncbi:MAG: alpha-hydroxy-acid oxidizing protein [Okeania sp. SIO3B3]|nr:alpha-hydroxy-acid oxidizing protein [Okeania sp. SIO3B3]
MITDLTQLQTIALVKGILQRDNAIKTVEHETKGIIVSDRGDRQLDGAIVTLDALSEVVAAVINQVYVVIDRGIRRSTYIIKALALVV